MPVYQVVILAIVQGLTEFLPISSSAHLALAPWLLGWKDPGLAFDIALHLGTLAAVLLYFFRDWLQIAAQGFGLKFGNDEQLKRNPRLLWYLAAASLPIGIAGLAFGEQAETTWRSPWVIGFMLISVGVLMLIADKRSFGTRDMAHVSVADSMTIGAAQALAVVPGTSRSGVTITAGLFRNLDRATAARFSFLLSTPAIAAAGAKALHDLKKHGGLDADERTAFILGIVISAITGCFVIAFFLNYLRRHSLSFFVWYRFALGALVLALAAMGRT